MLKDTNYIVSTKNSLLPLQWDLHDKHELKLKAGLDPCNSESD